MDAPDCSPAVGAPPAPVPIEPEVPGAKPTAAARDQHAGGVRGHRDGDDGDQREHGHRDQLGDQQPGPAHRAGQQVAQRARRGLARDRIAGHHRDGDRQEHRQHERQRRRRVQLPLVEHGGQECAARTRRRRDVRHRDEDRREQRQRADHPDR
jgi:hypothetical protein